MIRRARPCQRVRSVRQPMLRLHDEIIVDSFAGGGGASLGIELAMGRSPDIAINHDANAIAVHKANHPETQHFCENVYKVDPVEVCAGRKVGLAWFSPDCTHHSNAKGGKPVKKKIRGLAWVVVTWAATVRPRVIVVENVAEFADWGPLGPDGRPCKKRKGKLYDAWVRRIEKYGYKHEARMLRGCDYGIDGFEAAPTTRNRRFMIFRCDGQPIAWPEPTHGPGRPLPHRTAAECIDFTLPCPSIFLSKAQGKKLGVKRPLAVNTRRRIARGIWKYVINAARPFIVPVTHPTDQRVHSVDEPLRTITSARRGELALVAPVIARTAHGEGAGTTKRRGRGEHPVGEPLPTIMTSRDFAVVAPMLSPYYGERHAGEVRGSAVDAPLPTQTAANRFGLVAATLVQTGYGERPGQAPRALDIEAPLGTVVGCGPKHAVCQAFLAKNFGGRPETGGRSPGSSLHDPMSAVTARDHHSLVTTNLIKLRGTDDSQLDSSGLDVAAPLPTIAANGNHFAKVDAFLVKYYSADGSDPGGQVQGLDEPLHTITAKPRYGLVMVDGEPYSIADIGLRMLVPRELFRAQGFPDSYIIDPIVEHKPKKRRGRRAHRAPVMKRLSKEAQIRCVGNSVCPPLAAAIVRANMMVSAVERREAAVA